MGSDSRGASDEGSGADGANNEVLHATPVLNWEKKSQEIFWEEREPEEIEGSWKEGRGPKIGGKKF